MVSSRGGVCEVGIPQTMFGFGLYIDCQFVPPDQLIAVPDQSPVLGELLLFTLVGDACAYLESHPSARLDVVQLPGPHGGP